VCYPYHMSESDNCMVWDRRQRGHYEVWYSTFNHRRSEAGFWIRYTLESPLPDHGEPYCQLWFAYFDPSHPQRSLAINRRLPIDELVADDHPFRLRLGEAELRHDGMRGAITGDTHDVSWDLHYQPTLFTHRHLPDSIYRGSFADTTVLSPNVIINLEGQLTVDGQTFTFEGDPGGQSHLWGRKHAHAWAWSHCSSFREDSTACLETISVRLRRLGVVTPPLTFLSLYLGSEVYELRQLENIPFNRASWETGLYRVSGVGRRARIEGELRCRPEDLLQATYQDPDGTLCYCHNTEVADATVTLWTRRSLGATFKRVVQLTSRGNAHFEYARRVPDGHVTRKHVTVR
jgi:hypothetical protein